MPTATPQPTVVILPDDPNALARAILDHHDPDYAAEVYEALRLVFAPSFMDVLGGMRDRVAKPLPDPATFSNLQLDIVRHIYREEQVARKLHDAGFLRSENWHRVWWHPEDLGGDMTPSRRASISRSLRRLEERKIVHRWSGPGGRRSIGVNLTSKGEELAERLVNE